MKNAPRLVGANDESAVVKLPDSSVGDFLLYRRTWKRNEWG